MSHATVPVIITKEAAEEVATLGMERELELMVDWTQKNVPYLQAIRVAPRYPESRHWWMYLVIKAHCKWSDELANAIPIEWDWAGWKADTFPPAVSSRFIMSCTFQPMPTV
jgi:hypothetical protein